MATNPDSTNPAAAGLWLNRGSRPTTSRSRLDGVETDLSGICFNIFVMIVHSLHFQICTEPLHAMLNVPIYPVLFNGALISPVSERLRRHPAILKLLLIAGLVKRFMRNPMLFVGSAWSGRYETELVFKELFRIPGVSLQGRGNVLRRYVALHNY